MIKIIQNSKKSDIVRRNSTILAPSFRFKIELSSTLELPNTVIEDVDDHGNLLLPVPDTVTYRSRVDKSAGARRADWAGFPRKVKVSFAEISRFSTSKSTDSSNEFWQENLEPKEETENHLVEKIQWLELGIATGKRKKLFYKKKERSEVSRLKT